MSEQFSSIGDMITLVANDQHAEATPVLHDLLGARILDALQGHKQEIAQTLFAPGTEALAEGSEQVSKKHDDTKEDTKLVKKLVKKDCLAEEELVEISKATALSVSDKRNKKGESDRKASARSADPLTKKVLFNHSIKMFTKANKAQNYADKKKD